MSMRTQGLDITILRPLYLFIVTLMGNVEEESDYIAAE